MTAPSISLSTWAVVHTLCATVFAAGVLVGPADAQEPPPFRAGVELVEIAVSVSDADGHPIPDLAVDDFRVRIDGRVRPVQTFGAWSVGTDHASLGECRPTDGVIDASNARRWAVARHAAEDGHRLVAVVLDDVLTSSRRTMVVRREARTFVERRLAEGDAVAVITTSGQANIDASFTTARDAALTRIDRFFGHAVEHNVRGFSAAIATRRMLEVLADLGRISHELQGRPLTVVLFSEGLEYDIYDQRQLDASDVIKAIRDTVESLRAGNLVLYAIDPRGLVTPEDGLVERNTYVEDRSMTGAIASTMRMAAVRRSLQSLRQLAEETGGFAAVDRNTFEGTFDRIAAETGSLYLLGVEPGAISTRRDGSRIEVSVQREGARVSSRRRIVRPARTDVGRTAGERQVAVRALLASPTSAGTLPISAQVIPVGMRDDHASTQTAFVLVEVDAQGFRAIMGDVLGSTMTDAARTRTLAVDLALLPMDDGGDAAAPVTAAIATIRLSEDMRSRLSQHGFRWLHQVALPDTTRELRVAAHIDGHRSGMVITPVEPSGAASGDAPFIGAVVVASTSSGGAVTAGDFASLPFAKAIPTTRRVFEAGDVLEFAVGIVTDGTAVVEDDVIVTLTSTGGRARQITLDPAGAGFHAGMMPLAGYPAGDHAVEVSARFVAGSERRVLPLCVR